jgi:hypothetical protein
MSKKPAAIQFRSVVIRPTRTFPPIGTSQPAQPYSFLQFLQDWVLGAKDLRTDANLDHYFEWHEAIKLLKEETDVLYPAVTPLDAKDVEAAVKEAGEGEAGQKVANEMFAAHAAAEKDRATAIDAARVGKKLYLSDAAFMAGANGARAAIDAAMEPRNIGGRMMPLLMADYAPEVLWHYHAMRQSQLIQESDVPKPADEATSEQN